MRDQCEFFVHRTRVTRNLQSSKIRFIFGFYSCDKKLIKVHCTAVSYELKHVSDLSMLVFYFRGHAFVVYLRTIKVHNDSVFK